METWEIEGLGPKLYITLDLQSRAMVHKDNLLDSYAANLMKMHTNIKKHMIQSFLFSKLHAWVPSMFCVLGTPNLTLILCVTCRSNAH